MSVQNRTLCLMLRAENEDIWFLTERDWSQESVHDNSTMGIIWFLLWWTFQFEDCFFYISRDTGILYSVFYHRFKLHISWYHHFPKLHNTKTSVSLKRKRYSKKENSIFYFLKRLSNKLQFFFNFTGTLGNFLTHTTLLWTLPIMDIIIKLTSPSMSAITRFDCD